MKRQLVRRPVANFISSLLLSMIVTVFLWQGRAMADDPPGGGDGTRHRVVSPGLISLMDVTDSAGRNIANYDIYFPTLDFRDFAEASAKCGLAIVRPEYSVFCVLKGIESMDRIDPMARVEVYVTGTIFSYVKLVVGGSCWLLRHAMNFDIAERLTDPIDELVQKYELHFVQRFGLINLFLMLCVFWFGLAALRGRVGHGVGQILVSFLLSVVGAAILAAPGKTLLGADGLTQSVQNFAIEVSSVAMGNDQSGSSDPAQPGEFQRTKEFEHAIVDIFIRKPHQLLAYGADLDDPGGPHHHCVDEYDRMIDRGRWANPYREMRCDWLNLNLVTFSTERPVGAFLVLVAALVVAVFVFVGVILPVIGSQILMAFLAVAFVFVFPIALLGGGARSPLWAWVGAVFGALLSVVMGFINFTLLLITIKAIIGFEGVDLLIKLLLVDVVAVTLLIAHRRIQAGMWGRGVPRFAGRWLTYRLSVKPPYPPSMPPQLRLQELHEERKKRRHDLWERGRKLAPKRGDAKTMVKIIGVAAAGTATGGTATAAAAVAAIIPSGKPKRHRRR